jgi:tRNA(adenine34) deaminase
VVAKAVNRREGDADPTAHAEILVLRHAAITLSRWRLGGTLYVTLEPCAMCAGALVLARVNRLVFGATDPKAGACGSCIDVIRAPYVNHRIEVVGGLLAEASAALLQGFFRQRRGTRE